jgi:hypothetical protein
MPPVLRGRQKRIKVMTRLIQRLLKVAVLAVFIASVSFPAAVTRAQAPEGPDTSSSTTEDSTGKVTEISRNATITVDSRRGPFTYRLGRDLHVVDADGKPAKIDRVRVGQKVTVYYYLRDGQQTVARIAILKEASKKD